MFDDKTLQLFRDQLLEKQAELHGIEATGDEAAKTVELDQSRVGRLSRMDALQGQAMSLEAKRRRTLELQKITGALQRLEQGGYGYCVKCGEEIAGKRLELDPATPLCIGCAREADARRV